MRGWDGPLRRRAHSSIPHSSSPQSSYGSHISTCRGSGFEHHLTGFEHHVNHVYPVSHFLRTARAQCWLCGDDRGSLWKGWKTQESVNNMRIDQGGHRQCHLNTFKDKHIHIDIISFLKKGFYSFSSRVFSVSRCRVPKSWSPCQMWIIRLRDVWPQHPPTYFKHMCECIGACMCM